MRNLGLEAIFGSLDPGRERCIRPRVLSAEMNVRFLLSLHKASQYTAGPALPSAGLSSEAAQEWWITTS